MKNNHWKTRAIILIACLCNLPVSAQVTAEQLRIFISDDRYSNAEVREFYTRLNYKTAWIQKENTINRDIILNALRLSTGMGLQETDYQFNYIGAFRNGTLHLQNIDDSLEAELKFTDAALHFYKDVAYGNTKPSFGYNGLKYIPGCYNIPELLADHLLKNTLPLLISRLSSSLPEINAIENKIKWFNSVISDTNFREVTIASNKATGTNIPLVTKLYYLGITRSVTTKIPDSTLKQKIKEAQQQFNLLADGVLRSTIVKELNTPLPVRLQQLILSVNYYRWLHCLIQNQSVIVVNIPAAYLKVYKNNQVVLDMRMIVGKRSTPTPTLTSRIDEVILYPYWHVPHSIATKELLPAIKRNPGFINAGNYQVLNLNGKIMDPYSINWKTLSRSYFPYVIRQSTGCDNALGLLKLNFYSPFGVYLHDTPGKNLFMLNKRYFSHGCMRMEKPMEMGHLVLKNNPIAIDTLEQKGCLRNQSPITVKADEHIPVIVWYNPVGIDSTGRIIFYEDIYGKFDWMKRK